MEVWKFTSGRRLPDSHSRNMPSDTRVRSGYLISFYGEVIDPRQSTEDEPQSPTHQRTVCKPSQGVKIHCAPCPVIFSGIDCCVTQRSKWTGEKPKAEVPPTIFKRGRKPGPAKNIYDQM